MSVPLRLIWIYTVGSGPCVLILRVIKVVHSFGSFLYAKCCYIISKKMLELKFKVFCYLLMCLKTCWVIGKQ